ncbi:MAG: dockerin type I domain-containing protein, partial [Oscillospiraceae bacterium]|nr:dockerin type I domain-containing protein [Oscillospiraceae bacterium]
MKLKKTLGVVIAACLLTNAVNLSVVTPSKELVSRAKIVDDTITAPPTTTATTPEPATTATTTEPATTATAIEPTTTTTEPSDDATNGHIIIVKSSSIVNEPSSTVDNGNGNIVKTISSSVEPLTTTLAPNDTPPTTRNSPSQGEIKRAWHNSGVDQSGKVIYDAEPNGKTLPLVAGKVSQASLDNGLSYLNFVRYISDLNPITFSDEYNDLTQHGAVLLEYLGELNHTPAQPTGVDKAFYDKAYSGLSQSNIAWGGNNLSSTVNMFMDDSNSGNISSVGHRRWILNPFMQQTGFGSSGEFSVMYSFDGSKQLWNSSNLRTFDYIPWPPANMPYELYQGEAFSISLSNNYAITGDVSVTLSSKLRGETYTLDKNDTSTAYGDEYFTVNKEGYGVTPCIIFRPSDSNFALGDTVTVTVNGLDKPLSYTVNFFSVAEIKGDVNTDDIVNIADVTELQRYLLGNVNEIDNLNSDIDGAKGISAADLVYLKRALAGWEQYTDNVDTAATHATIPTKSTETIEPTK